MNKKGRERVNKHKTATKQGYKERERKGRTNKKRKHMGKKDGAEITWSEQGERKAKRANQGTQETTTSDGER